MARYLTVTSRGFAYALPAEAVTPDLDPDVGSSIERVLAHVVAPGRVPGSLSEVAGLLSLSGPRPCAEEVALAISIVLDGVDERRLVLGLVDELAMDSVTIAASLGRTARDIDEVLVRARFPGVGPDLLDGLRSLPSDWRIAETAEQVLADAVTIGGFEPDRDDLAAAVVPRLEGVDRVTVAEGLTRDLGIGVETAADLLGLAAVELEVLLLQRRYPRLQPSALRLVATVTERLTPGAARRVLSESVLLLAPWSDTPSREDIATAVALSAGPGHVPTLALSFVEDLGLGVAVASDILGTDTTEVDRVLVEAWFATEPWNTFEPPAALVVPSSPAPSGGGRVRRPPRSRAPRIVVLIPAHNEEAQIGATIESALNQTRPPDLIVVAADNRVDRTVEIASSYGGVEVFETVANRMRKAGALNQAWRRYAGDATYVLTIDADTILAPDFVRSALEELDEPRLGGLSARFGVKPGDGLLWRLQRLEYARAEDDKLLRSMRVSVLAGAGCMYRQETLVDVVTSRGSEGPDGPWDGTTLVEDYALTLDARERGWEVRGSRGMQAYTDTMPTLGDLWRQRLRWERGTIDELRRRGWTAVTRRDILLHVLVCWLVLVRVLWLALIVVALVVGLGFRWHPIWLAPIVLAVAERITSLRVLEGRDWRDLGLGGSLVVEEIYSTFQHAYFVCAVWSSYRKKVEAW